MTREETQEREDAVILALDEARENGLMRCDIYQHPILPDARHTRVREANVFCGYRFIGRVGWSQTKGYWDEIPSPRKLKCARNSRSSSQ